MREQIEQLIADLEVRRDELRKVRDLTTDNIHYRIYDAKLASLFYVNDRLRAILASSDAVSEEIGTQGRV